MLSIFHRNHVYLLESGSTFLKLMMASVQCSICESSPGTTTILRESGSDNIRERIHYCELQKVLFKTDAIKICDKCVQRLDECYRLYKSYERRICERYCKTPACCLICHVDDVTVHEHHIGEALQKERALQHLSQICLTTFESLFVHVCGECWHLVEILHYFYCKVESDPESGTPGSSMDHNLSDTSSSASIEVLYEF